LTGEPPRLEIEEVRAGSLYRFVDPAIAEHGFGLPSRPLRDTLADTAS
jgi:hypothetical protein